MGLRLVDPVLRLAKVGSSCVTLGQGWLILCTLGLIPYVTYGLISCVMLGLIYCVKLSLGLLLMLGLA
jgi:hypothetical protein